MFPLFLLLQLLALTQNVRIVLNDVEILSQANDSGAEICEFCNKIIYSIACFSDSEFELFPPESVLFLKVFELVLQLIQFPEVPGCGGLLSQNKSAVIQKLVELGYAELKLGVSS